MRWEHLEIEREHAATLPGYREQATVRRFDAPEALDMRFYEVRAKSVLNRVPEKSKMPFRWTINPYRGCSHACVYCLDGDTRIQMADGRQRALRDIRVGDRVYGTIRRGRYRRYVETTVVAHWKTRKPAFQILLADGTSIVASGDHRFLTGRGWKFVTGRTSGRSRRPHLTENDSLLGIGDVGPTPHESAEYRRGYLTGMIRGDGHVGSYCYEREGRPNGARVHRFRLALTDGEPLVRSRAYLDAVDVPTDHFLFAAAAPGQKRAYAIRTSRRAAVAAIATEVAWPASPTSEWERGFVAGIFDAEGSYSRGILRISNTDEEMLRTTMVALEHAGFSAVVEAPSGRGATSIRVRGGLREHVRFFQFFDPATTRKRVFAGQAHKSAADLRIVAVAPLDGERPLYDITTGTGDFIANGVVSHNCFARPTHTYLDFNAGRDFEREIVVKINAPEAARAELSRPRWKREHVAMGTNTDPYQWVESKYRLMPGIWEALRDSDTPCSILTKSPLLLRDADLMVEIAERGTPVYADLSIPTWDERAWRATEPHTPSPKARMEAVAELNRRGIPTGILVAPLIPGINDAPHQLAPLLEAAAEAGAVQIGGIGLHLRGQVRDVFMDWLRSARPELVDLYEELYEGGAYLPQHERRRLARLIRAEARDPAPANATGEGTQRFEELRARRRGAAERREEVSRAPALAAAQESLF